MAVREFVNFERWPAVMLVVTVTFMAAANVYSSILSQNTYSAGPDVNYPIRIELAPASPVARGEAELLLSAQTASASDWPPSTGATEAVAGPDRGDGPSPSAGVGGGPAREIVLASPRVPASNTVRSGGLMAVDFDLSDPYARSDDGGSAIEIRKTVRFNGADVGPAIIRVSSGSTLSVARGELSRLLASAGRSDMAAQVEGASTGGFISFDEMRRQGIQVRYDASSDRVLLSN